MYFIYRDMRKNSILFLVACLLFPVFLFSQRPGSGNIDSAKKVAASNLGSDSIFINTSFYIAEKYMARDLYDSCQAWLNYIAERLPMRKPSYFNVYLSTYQASTYYYTGLMRMALQESERVKRLATELNDSVLIGTGYNLIGLSYMNMDSIERAIPQFLEGIKYTRQPPYEIDYFTSSKPHHMYGNLAECYLKLGKYEKAISTGITSKKLATEISWMRGAAVAANALGLAYARSNHIDSAFYFEREAISISSSAGQPDVTLVSYSALAECFLLKNEFDSVHALLNRGFQLLQEKPYLNDQFVKQFLSDVIRMSPVIHQPQLQLKALRLKDSIASVLARKNDAQISMLVKGSVANEMRVANLEVAESRQKQSLSNTRLILALVALGSMIILFLLYRYYHKKRLKEIAIRNKISRDLHDDIGATLSSIKIYGELANTVLDDKPAESKAMIGKITEQSKDLMQRMGDVIWSMKPAAETNNSFTARVRNYSSDLLAPKDISCEIDIDESMCSKISNPITRKHLLLIVKEALNNIAKYSAATEARINFKQENDKLVLLISDNGKGFSNPDNVSGNGLGNMRQRCEQCHGTFKIDSIPGKGVTVTAEFSIAIFSHSV